MSNDDLLILDNMPGPCPVYDEESGLAWNESEDAVGGEPSDDLTVVELPNVALSGTGPIPSEPDKPRPEHMSRLLERAYKLYTSMRSERNALFDEVHDQELHVASLNARISALKSEAADWQSEKARRDEANCSHLEKITKLDNENQQLQDSHRRMKNAEELSRVKYLSMYKRSLRYKVFVQSLWNHPMLRAWRYLTCPYHWLCGTLTSQSLEEIFESLEHETSSQGDDGCEMGRSEDFL